MDDRVVVVDDPWPSVRAVDDGRGDELVGLAAGIRGLDGRRRRRRVVRRLAVDDGVVAALRRAPSACRGPSRSSGRPRSRSRASGWAAASRGSRSAMTSPSAERGRRVPPVEQCVDAHARARFALRELAMATRCRSLAWTPPGPMRLTRCRVPLRSTPPGRRPRGTPAARRSEPSAMAASMRGQVLEHRAAGTEVQVADLGVAHLARLAGRRRPPTRRGRACGQRSRRPRQIGIGAAAMASTAGIAPDPEPVEDDEDDRAGPADRGGPRSRRGARGRGRSARPVATIPAISSGLREAPPTSAPSMAGSARNSPMFADVTLPP